jgi:hypothetical protein
MNVIIKHFFCNKIKKEKEKPLKNQTEQIRHQKFLIPPARKQFRRAAVDLKKPFGSAEWWRTINRSTVEYIRLII